MTKITDETPIAMLTVGQLKEILGIDRILGNLTAHQTPTEQVMTVEEVVRLTGYSKVTIYKFTSERKIPFRKPPTLPGLQGTVSLRSISSQVNERYRSTNRSIKAANFTLTVRRFSTGCRANHTRRSNRKTSEK